MRVNTIDWCIPTCINPVGSDVLNFPVALCNKAHATCLYFLLSSLLYTSRVSVENQRASIPGMGYEAWKRCPAPPLILLIFSGCFCDLLLLPPFINRQVSPTKGQLAKVALFSYSMSHAPKYLCHPKPRQSSLSNIFIYSLHNRVHAKADTHQTYITYNEHPLNVNRMLDEATVDGPNRDRVRK